MMQKVLNKAIARQLALSYIQENYSGTLTVEIIDDQTIEKDYGWIFFFQSREYLDTRNFRFSLLGNGPLIVEQDGSVHILTTAQPAEESIAKFEERYKNTEA